jgi:hypothetical protein
MNVLSSARCWLINLVTANEAINVIDKNVIDKEVPTNRSSALDISFRVPDKDIGRNGLGSALPKLLWREV